MMKNIVSIVRKIFVAAVWVMSRLWYWQKFALMTILFTIPVGFALFSYITQIDQNIALAERETVGIQYLSPVLDLIQDLQQHRGMASLYIRGDTSFLPRLAENEEKIRRDFAMIDANLAFATELGIADTSPALQEKWALLEKSYPQLEPKESANQHTELIADVFVFIGSIGDASKLVLDPDLDSHYLMNTIVNTLPNLSENLGQARAFTLSVGDPKKVSDPERRDIINYANIARIANGKIVRDLRVAFEDNHSLEADLARQLQETTVPIENFASLLNTFVNTSEIKMPLPEYYEFATTVINTNFSLIRSISTSLNTLLRQRIERLHGEKNMSIEITVYSYLLILYFFTGFYLLVARTVRELETIAQELTSGKTTEFPVVGDDELGKIGASFNTIGRALIASNDENLEKARELQQKADELERMNSLMVGRELRMVELKKEIEALRKKSGNAS